MRNHGATMNRWIFRLSAFIAMTLTPIIAYAQISIPFSVGIGDSAGDNYRIVKDGRLDLTGIWVFANISYAGMRAQKSLSYGWRLIAFIFGFPGTLITWFIVKEGSERAYGIDWPKRTL